MIIFQVYRQAYRQDDDRLWANHLGTQILTSPFARYTLKPLLTVMQSESGQNMLQITWPFEKGWQLMNLWMVPPTWFVRHTRKVPLEYAQNWLSTYRSTCACPQIWYFFLAALIFAMNWYMSEFLSMFLQRISLFWGSFPPAKYCSAPQYTMGIPTEVMAMAWQARWCFFLDSQSPPQLRVLALSWLSQKLAMQLRRLESIFLPHSLQQLRRLYMSFWLKRVSLTQKKKAQLRTASIEPRQPPRYHMLPSKTSPTEYTPEAWVNWLQNHLGTSGMVSILMPSM